MNAIQFIKENGVDKARKVVEGAPDLAEYYSTIDGEYYRIELHAVNLRHLKRLVESVDFINKFGGIINAKHELILLQKHLNNTFGYVTIITSEKIENLEQAIADYESIGGEHV